VDGCRAGWFGVCFLAGGGWEAGLFPTLGGLWERWGSARLILIDMPIGLPGRGPADRDREREARRLLGVRRSSIFPVPCRPAVAASSETLALRAERRTAGRGLSRQSLALIPKIRELDRLLTLRPGSRRVLRESHPELCFLGMNGGQPLRFGKKSPEGREERLALLDARRPGSRRIAERCFRDHLQGTAPDDILDALGLAVAARAPLRLLASVPSRAASRDSRGLPMRIVFVPFGDPDAGRRVVS
jgi:predicted RNase H-like nuclease